MANLVGTFSDYFRLTSGTISSIISPSMNENPIQAAILIAGSGPKLAKQLGISARAIYKWSARWEGGVVAAVPAHRAIAIETVTGISRARLRPDLWGEQSPHSQAA
jgi:DNA-binding transcriptional regulator YdaS (Cro superfamily)